MIMFAKFNYGFCCFNSSNMGMLLYCWLFQTYPRLFQNSYIFQSLSICFPAKKSSTWHRLSIDVKSTISISHSKPIIILQNVPKHHQNTGSMKRTAAWSGSAHHGFRVQRAPAPRPAPREMQRRWPAVARRWESAARPFWRCHRLRNALGELELGDRAGKKTHKSWAHIYI